MHSLIELFIFFLWCRLHLGTDVTCRFFFFFFRNKGNVEMKERGRERLADVMRCGEGVSSLALPLLSSPLIAALGDSQANTNSFSSAACPLSL